MQINELLLISARLRCVALLEWLCIMTRDYRPNQSKKQATMSHVRTISLHPARQTSLAARHDGESHMRCR